MVKTASVRSLPRLSPEGGNPDWHAWYSDSARYNVDDLFDVGLWEFIRQTLVRTTISRIVTFSISILSILVFGLVVALMALGYEPPPYDGSSESALGVLMYALAEWLGWSKSLTGNSYLVTSALSLLIAFLSQAGFSFLLVKQRSEYDRLIERGRVVTKHARQIYVGSGTLRFSYGKKGIRVTGNNVTFDVSWDAVDPFFMTSLLRASRAKRWGREHVDYMAEGDVEKATHLLIYFDIAGGNPSVKKRINAAEYLVVPRRFFSPIGGTMDSSSWQGFVENIAQYKQAFTDARRPT